MIICKSTAEIEKLRRSGQVVTQLLEELRQRVRPGITTLELEKYVELRLPQLGARSAFKDYRGYPHCLCTSINEEVIHGMPSGRHLKDGDIIGLDMGVVVDNYYGDSAITIPAGRIAPAAQRLLQVAEEALELAIERTRVGSRVGDLSAAIQEHAEKNGYSVVREFVGHGIGLSLHEEPQVPNYGRAGRGPVLKEGMVLALETMINEGTEAVQIKADKWTAITADAKLSAHFEHMVAVTRNGPDVLTRPDSRKWAWRTRFESAPAASGF
jgi:methionyl aminopeptidase